MRPQVMPPGATTPQVAPEQMSVTADTAVPLTCHSPGPRSAVPGRDWQPTHQGIQAPRLIRDDSQADSAWSRCHSPAAKCQLELKACGSRRTDGDADRDDAVGTERDGDPAGRDGDLSAVTGDHKGAALRSEAR